MVFVYACTKQATWKCGARPTPFPIGRDALTRRCETLDGDGCRHDSHRAKVHDSEN